MESDPKENNGEVKFNDDKDEDFESVDVDWNQSKDEMMQELCVRKLV